MNKKVTWRNYLMGLSLIIVYAGWLYYFDLPVGKFRRITARTGRLLSEIPTGTFPEELTVFLKAIGGLFLGLGILFFIYSVLFPANSQWVYDAFKNSWNELFKNKTE